MQFQRSRPEPLSGKDEGSFAYLTIRDRLPDILTKVIDLVHRRATALVKVGTNELEDDAKGIVSKLSKLKYEMQTNKKLTLVEDNGPDRESWNQFILSSRNLMDEEPVSWFGGAWLTCECFMYRKIYEAFASSSHHKLFDPFEHQKQHSYSAMETSVTLLAQHLVDYINDGVSQETDTKSHFETFLQFSLWGNKCDLSISSGELHVQLQHKDAGLISNIEKLKDRILVNHAVLVWNLLKGCQLKGTAERTDFVLDNAGFELFTDLCLAEFLLHSNLTKSVNLHLKKIPWFVSDALTKDLLWMLDKMKNSASEAVSYLGNKWAGRINDGSFVLREHEFWSLPHDYSLLKSQSSELYEDLSEANLIFFKGDLNYRKLVGDRKWLHFAPFEIALWGFCPTAICALRTLKADVQVGLLEGQDTELDKQDKDWMINGSYAVIQFAGKAV